MKSKRKEVSDSAEKMKLWTQGYEAGKAESSFEYAQSVGDITKRLANVHKSYKAELTGLYTELNAAKASVEWHQGQLRDNDAEVIRLTAVADHLAELELQLTTAKALMQREYGRGVKAGRDRQVKAFQAAAKQAWEGYDTAEKMDKAKAFRDKINAIGSGPQSRATL